MVIIDIDITISEITYKITNLHPRLISGYHVSAESKHT